MSDVASRELSETLHKLSGWVELPDNSWEYLRLSDVEANELDKQLWFNGIPAYTLSWMLRKAPKNIQIDETVGWLVLSENNSGWQCGFLMNPGYMERQYHMNANTPEDAACGLLIKLIEQKVIKI